MLFVATAYFKPGGPDMDADMRAALADHLRSNHPRLKLGGPLKNAAGAVGAIFYVAEADRREVLEAFINQSPCTRAGLYDRIEINELTLEAGSLG